MRVAGQASKRTRLRELEGMAGWLLRRFRGVHADEQRQMRLMETLSLGGKRQLMLIECGGERYLVGGGLESVQTIVPVSRQTAVSGIAEYR